MNPWEKSTTFNNRQEFLKPGHHHPKVGGGSLPLAKPSTHELYVSPCQRCVGILSMVYTWNAAVETALHHKDIGEAREIEIKVNTFDFCFVLCVCVCVFIVIIKLVKPI